MAVTDGLCTLTLTRRHDCNTDGMWGEQVVVKRLQADRPRQYNAHGASLTNTVGFTLNVSK